MRLTTSVPAETFKILPKPGDTLPIVWGQMVISAVVYNAKQDGPTVTLDLSIYADVRTWSEGMSRRWTAPSNLRKDFPPVWKTVTEGS